MSYDVAIVKEQGVTFVVVCVEDSVLDSSSRSDEVWRKYQRQYGLPTAIVGAQRYRIFGDHRIVPFLGSVDLTQLPWRRAA